MAATSAHIKSKMAAADGSAGAGGRWLAAQKKTIHGQLVLRLLEYRKPKAAAAELANRGTLWNRCFPAPGVFGDQFRRDLHRQHWRRSSRFSTRSSTSLKRSSVRLITRMLFDRISIMAVSHWSLRRDSRRA